MLLHEKLSKRDVKQGMLRVQAKAAHKPGFVEDLTPVFVICYALEC